ncbi:MAG: topoisomerase IV, partial [Clostridia bacterium]|nr:topoisomerase IV [Clostridia bacterium]
EQKMKDGDEIINAEECENRSRLMFFTDKAQLYKCRAADFDPVKASALGDFISAKLGFDEDERPVMMKAYDSLDTKDNIIFIFENGKGVKIPVSAYETKTNRKKLTGAFSSASPVVAVIYEKEPVDLFIENSAGRAILLSSNLIPQKSTRSSQGVTLFTLKKGVKITSVKYGSSIDADVVAGCRKKKIPATGASLLKGAGEQLKFE